MSLLRIIHLVIGDDASRDSFDLLLKMDGYEVNTYASAQLLLAKINKTDSGCILTGVNLPGTSGLDLLLALNDRGICLPVIVLSGFPDAETEITARNRGAVDFLETPVDPEILLAAIRNAISRSESKGG